MLLKFVPAALLMAPDGLTAYILSNTGTITYYDVLSGTSDLTVSTYPPGSNAGYPGVRQRGVPSTPMGLASSGTWEWR